MRRALRNRIEALRAQTEATLENDRQAIAQAAELGQRVERLEAEVDADRALLDEWNTVG